MAWGPALLRELSGWEVSSSFVRVKGKAVGCACDLRRGMLSCECFTSVRISVVDAFKVIRVCGCDFRWPV